MIRTQYLDQFIALRAAPDILRHAPGAHQEAGAGTGTAEGSDEMSAKPGSELLSRAKDGMCPEGLRLLHDVMDTADEIHKRKGSLAGVRLRGMAVMQQHIESCSDCLLAAVRLGVALRAEWIV